MEKKLPFLQRLVLVLLLIISLGYLLFIGQDILTPLAFAGLLSILLLPVVKFLIKRKFPHSLAILISILLAVIVFSGLIYFLAKEISLFISDGNAIKKQLAAHFKTMQEWLSIQFNLSPKEQTQIINDTTDNIKNSGPAAIGSTFFSITGSLLTITLLPIYTFLILYYRRMLKQFIIDIFNEKHQQKVEQVLKQSDSIVFSYMAGLLIELAIISAINTAGFMIIGIKYAVFLAVLAAILNMIPYIGMLIAGIFCMLITLSTSSNIADTIWVVVVLTAVQFIDNNIIMPLIVTSKVKINALMSIIAVLVGGALAGVSGMFLSIPVLAILKAVFDQVEELKPWGRVLGDEITVNKENKVYSKIKRMAKKKK